LEEAIEEFLKNYPFAQHSEIGVSRLNRPLYAITMGRGEKSVLINASHHANEWITTLIAMRFAEDCAKKYENWEKNISLHIIPLVNPDGVDLVTGGIGKLRIAYQEAKAMVSDPSTFPDCWKANICGVDLNSNYPSNWELARRSKFSRGYTKAGARDYVGTSPLSEPETSAMAAYTIANDIDITISLHTQGEEIYWRYMDYNPPGAAELAQRFEAVSGYKLEEVPDESSHAGYRDWFISTFNRPGFTIECGLGESPLPLSQFDEIYAKVSPLLWESFL